VIASLHAISLNILDSVCFQLLPDQPTSLCKWPLLVSPLSGLRNFICWVPVNCSVNTTYYQSGFRFSQCVAQDPVILRYGTVSVGNRIPMFRGPADPWKWRRFASKRWDPIIHWRSVMSQKNGVQSLCCLTVHLTSVLCKLRLRPGAWLNSSVKLFVHPLHQFFFPMTRQPLGGLGRLIFRGFTITL
jgi:hypothetical protein